MKIARRRRRVVVHPARTDQGRRWPLPRKVVAAAEAWSGRRRCGRRRRRGSRR